NAMAVEPPQGELETPLIIKNPIKVTSAPQVEPRGAPSLGEHGPEILAELGYSPERIDELRARSVI
ncbi:MAG: CoA transferase, partial [Actinomycetota bacterium]